MFELVLFLAVIVLGFVILIYKFCFPEITKRMSEPVLLDYARSFFPVFLIVFLLRGFVVEPFRIPSGSMLPTLEIGDFILVNKFSYGVRLPILHTKVIETKQPERGDVVVFRWPGDNKTSFIKRLIGLPGDKIEYRNRQLYVNGNVVKSEYVGAYIPTGETLENDRFLQAIPIMTDSGETNQMVKYSTLLNKGSSATSFRSRSWVVPQGHYFMMGDNRDNSSDSRVWGFLPDKNIVGQAFFVWFHLNLNENGDGLKLARIGTSIKAVSVQSDD